MTYAHTGTITGASIRNNAIFMRTPRFSASILVSLLRDQTVATLPELMAALGTRSRRTAFRKLKEVPHRTSYTHRGAYYTLDELADFDERGLWSFGAVRFPLCQHN